MERSREGSSGNCNFLLLPSDPTAPRCRFYGFQFISCCVAGKGGGCQSWWPEFDTWTPQGGRRNLSSDCHAHPVTSAHSHLANRHTHPVTCATSHSAPTAQQQVNTREKKKEVSVCSLVDSEFESNFILFLGCASEAQCEKSGYCGWKETVLDLFVFYF